MATRRVLPFPLWQYLNQHLFSPGFTLNPKRFWRQYYNAYLERCWQKDCASKEEPSC
ncbi:MAG: hypothetical protein P3X23_005830 [Thermosynechococcus sp. Uc]|uniref:hypothetical protein n=1 Tax=Thermosynechococcus sp. Uc TaxID=3034853 RepID=UPI0019DE7C7C|nr:hypothetical protein [Thermosynechococcus sp. Uc]MDM7326623.1 hypothetical protein [Thermosynechococcus sp. Uc]HIK25870.1 hypothetical protein [Thermosynechococcus sp. M46_R2017_013]